MTPQETNNKTDTVNQHIKPKPNTDMITNTIRETIAETSEFKEAWRENIFKKMCQRQNKTPDILR